MPGYSRFTTDTVETIDRHIRPCKVLDLGCGTGRLTIPLDAKGFELTSVDCSNGMLDQLRAKLNAANRLDHVNVVQSSIEAFNDPTYCSEYGLALCVQTTLNYVLEESVMRSIAKNAFRHVYCAEGGLLIYDLVDLIESFSYSFPGVKRAVDVENRVDHPGQYVVSEQCKGQMGDEPFDYEAEDWFCRLWDAEQVLNIFLDEDFKRAPDDGLRRDLQQVYAGSGTSVEILTT